MTSTSRSASPGHGAPSRPLVAEDSVLDGLLADIPPEHAERLRAYIRANERRAGRMQLMLPVVQAMARTLDESEVIRELGRGARRVLDCENLVVASVDVDDSTAEILYESTKGVERASRFVPLGNGPVADAARNGLPVHRAPYDPIVASDDVLRGHPGTAAVIAAPMMHGRRLFGVVAACASTEDAFAQDDRDLLNTLAAQAASVLSKTRLFTESERERRLSDALADAARAVGESLRMGEVLRLVLRHAASLLRSEGGMIALTQDDYLHVVAAIGSAQVLAGVHLPIEGSLCGRVTRSGTAVISNDVTREPSAYRPMQRLIRLQKTLIVPLVTGRGTIGVLSVVNRSEDFGAEDARVLQRLADQVAVAIVNARLYEEVAEATREWTAAFDSIATAMAIVDEEGKILRYNSRALQFSGLETQRELVGRPFYQTVLGVRPPPDGPMERAMRDGALTVGTVESPSRGRVYEISAAPHPNGGAILTIDDVTALRSVAERYRMAVEAAADGLLILDLQGRITSFNPAARELAGTDDLVGVALADLVSPDVVETVNAHVQVVLAGEAQKHEYVILRPDSERRTVTVSLTPLRQGDRVLGAVVSLRDTTDERRARDAVAQSEARYQNLFESASDAIFTLDFRGAITSANSATCDVLGLPRDQLLGRSVFHIVADADVDRVTGGVRDALSGEARRYECTLVRRDGTRRLLSITNAPVRHGRVVTGVLAVARDVTDDRARADALTRSEARYQRLVESASDGIFTVDEEGNFTSVNRALELATGKHRDALLGTHFTSVLDPRDRDSVWEAFVGTLHGRRQRREVRYQDHQGRPRIGWVTTTPIFDAGRVTGLLGIVRDVSEERRLLDQLVRQERLAAVGQLVGGVAHELNNPLASVIACTELLLASPLASSQEHETLTALRDESQRAARIVSSLLTFTRQQRPKHAVTSVNDLLSRTLDLRRYALSVHGVALETDLDPTIPTTWGDPGQLQQLFLNLLSNAEQAVRDWEGERRIVVCSARVASRLVVTVQDTGPGIAPADLDRIFNPFYTTRSVGEGAGLGLSMADAIVREHGGRIYVDSTPGEGATFIVEIPLVTPPLEARLPDEPADAAAVADSSPLSILIVDDEPAIRFALRKYLESQGHQVVDAANGREAESRLAERSFDRIVLDLRMPEMSGDELFKRLLDKKPEVASRVVFLTGDVDSARAREFLESTGRPFLGKPFSFEELGAALFARARAS
jgi:PAS domain S-box-containing protein